MSLSVASLKKLKDRSSSALAAGAVSLLEKYISNCKKQDCSAFIKKINMQKDIIFSAIPTEPLMKNALLYIVSDLRQKSFENLKRELLQRTKYVTQYLSDVYDNLAEYGYKKIKRGMVVYTHNYSAAVLHLLLKAKKNGINFEVHITETRPTLGGRKMATELSKNNIPVTYYADAAIRLALKKADIALIGADTISEQGQVYGAIGSELLAEVAEKYDVPLYVCMASWKFNPRFLNEYEASSELQPVSELWPNAPRGVIVANYGYEKIHPKLVLGIISEFGIHKPQYLITELNKHHTWL